MNYNATTSVDTVTQTAGADTVTISAVNEINVGDSFNGGDDVDAIVINYIDGATAALDLRVPSFLNYEQLTFTNASGLAAVNLSATQFGAVGGLLPLSLVINATTSLQKISVYDAGGFDPNSIVFNGWTNTTDIFQLIGGVGSDVLNSSIVTDEMYGLAGDDTYKLGTNTDKVFENVNEGIDTVEAAFTYTLGANVEKLVLTGTSSVNGTGNALDNQLTGNSGANRLDGGVGADTMIGGAGGDFYYIDNVGDSIVENFNEGTDNVVSSISFSLIDPDLENLTLTGSTNINGTGNAANNKLNGNSGNNTLTGFAGNDFLDGNGGDDTYIGGLGNDTYYVDSASDSVTELSNQGIDMVNSSITYTLGAHVENLNMTGSAANNGTGNTLDNDITGTSGNNTLMGLEGNDTITGGRGNDTMIGGIGNDIYWLDATGDVITELLGEGTDTVNSSITYTLGANVENLNLTTTQSNSGTGNALNNILTGNGGDNTLTGLDGDDVLDGSTGDDTMIGGLGNDTYFVNVATDVLVEFAGEGTADLVKSTMNYTLLAEFEDLTLIGSNGLSGTGNNGDNYITGNTAGNALNGLDGNDYLNGGKGADTMTGGVGHDIYYIDNANDVVVEQSGQGTDRIYTFITHTMEANVEYMNMLSTGNISGTGNSLNNIITGNTGANNLYGMDGDDTLNAGVGADRMLGGFGNDIYQVENTGDQVIEGSAQGTDTVNASISYTLTDHVEKLILTGTTAINGTGNTLDNQIDGNSAVNVLSGGDGADTLWGAVGADTLTGGIGNDSFVFKAFDDSRTSMGVDSISDFTAGDKINVSLIDANNVSAGNQAFVMDAGGGLTVGEIGVTSLGGGVLQVTLRSDAAGVNDMIINVTASALVASDFIL